MQEKKIVTLETEAKQSTETPTQQDKTEDSVENHSRSASLQEGSNESET